jgi:uncharacterized membrane protein
MYTAEASIYVEADQQTAWDYVSNYEHFDQWMSNVIEVNKLSGSDSEWCMSGLLGIPVFWVATTTAIEAPRHLTWHLLEGSVDSKGFIKVEPGGSGSRITVHLEYAPPGGALGEAFASIFKDPQHMLERGLGHDQHKVEETETTAEARQTSRQSTTP